MKAYPDGMNSSHLLLQKAEMEGLCNLGRANRTLLLSGFYYHDIPDIEESTNAFGLSKTDQRVKDKWSAVVFVKK